MSRRYTLSAVVSVLLILAASSAADTFTVHGKRFGVGPNPSAVAAVDLNEDGLPDLVTANTGMLADPHEERPANDQVSVLLAAGKLQYTALPQLQSDFAPYAIAVANMDVLRAPDLVVGSFLATRNRDVSLFRNLADNVFEPSHFGVPDENLGYFRMRDGDDVPLYTAPGVTSLVVRDFNKDTFRDVVATGWSSDVLVYFPGAADTYLREPQLIRAEGGPRDVQAADLDGDGNLDLIIALSATREIGFWRGDGAGGFTPVERLASRGRQPHKVRAGDINKDGKIDLAVSHSHTDDSIVLFFGDGGFRFSVSQEIMLGPERNLLEKEVRDLLIEDLSGDGRLDLAAACYASGQVITLINQSKDAAVPQRFATETYTFKDGKPRALSAADFNGDGKADLAVALWDANAVSLLLNR